MGEGDKDDEKELEMVLKSNEANIEQPQKMLGILEEGVSEHSSQPHHDELYFGELQGKMRERITILTKNVEQNQRKFQIERQKEAEIDDATYPFEKYY